MKLREENLRRLGRDTFDVLIIGGGINGAVAASALAGKGVKTALIDRGDFAGFTSQNSSNLAWGGIKYMESNDFALVRDLCLSRNRLMDSYPSTVREIRFLTTVPKGFRHSPWLLWCGTWLYWLIGNGRTRTPRLLSRADIQREESIIQTANCAGGMEYSDAFLHDNDARFVFNFIRAALNRGCVAANYVESLGASRADGGWVTQARDSSGQLITIRSRALINAAGPFVDTHNQLTGQRTQHRHVLSKGVHLIVPRLTPVERVLAFFADDGRLFFAIPMGMRTCIGTTDTPVDDAHAGITDADIDFILNNINARLSLERPLTREDVISTRCGVRPLVVAGESGGQGGRDFLELSRKHALDINLPDQHLSVFGGKLTDCINVGNEVCDAVQAMGIAIPHPDYTWYGEPSAQQRAEFFLRAEHLNLDGYTAPESSEKLSTRLWRRYGEQAFELLESIRQDPQQAEVLIKGTEYLRCELQQAAEHEMVTKLDDFLRRRSKIAMVETREKIRASQGLAEACAMLFGDQAQDRLQEYFAADVANAAQDS